MWLAWSLNHQQYDARWWFQPFLIFTPREMIEFDLRTFWKNGVVIQPQGPRMPRNRRFWGFILSTTWWDEKITPVPWKWRNSPRMDHVKWKVTSSNQWFLEDIFVWGVQCLEDDWFPLKWFLFRDIRSFFVRVLEVFQAFFFSEYLFWIVLEIGMFEASSILAVTSKMFDDTTVEVFGW